MGSYIHTRKDGEVFLSLPLYVDQEWTRDGMDRKSPYYTGRLEEGWSETASRRQWAFLLSTEGEVFPPDGRSDLAAATIKYSDLPLDKIKDWAFAWDGAKVEYPRLYVQSGKLGEIRRRGLAPQGWKTDLKQHHFRPQQYVLEPDPKVGEELVRGRDGALTTLRQYVSRLFEEWGYVGYPAPNQAQPMIELVRFDVAMSAAQATPAEKQEMTQLAAFVAQMVYDPDWHPTRAGWHLGNPNMPPRQEHHLAVASAVLPTHPLAAAWRERGIAEQERLIEAMIRPSGAWRECPHYEWEAAMLPMFQAAVPLKLSGAHDLFADPRLKKTWDYLMGLLTPPDPRFAAAGRQLRVLPAFGNGSWEFVSLFGWLATMTRETDPDFSRRMAWAWQEQGRPDLNRMSRLVIDPDLPAEQPELRSANYSGFGCTLRSGFPSPDETWMAFRHGDCIEHYNYGDQGSFMLFGKGAPLVLHFGSIYTPYFQGAWHFNRACVNHRMVTPDDPVATPLEDPGRYALGTELWCEDGANDYVMHNKAFVSLEAADYARAEQVQQVQGIIGKDHTVRLPPNSPMPRFDIPDHTWIRQVLFLKDPDPAAPNYYLVRDDFRSDDPLPGEWNIWTLAERVEVGAAPARVVGRFGVDLEVYMVEPADPQWSTRQDTNRYLPSPSRHYLVADEWVEVLTNLRAEQVPGKGFLAVLYPRQRGEEAPEFTTLAGGCGVKVVTPRGVDYAFLAPEPIEWEGDGLRFRGRAGALRRVGDTWEIVLAEKGRVEVAGKTFVAREPMQKIVKP